MLNILIVAIVAAAAFGFGYFVGARARVKADIQAAVTDLKSVAKDATK